MIKLVVADFDGTILPYGEKTVSRSVVESIKKIIDSGINFAVASGRTYNELVTLLGDLSNKIYFICNDGALTIKSGKTLYKKPFSNNSLAKFFDEDLIKNAVLYAIDTAYIIGDAPNNIFFGKTPCRISKIHEIKSDVFKITATARKFDLVNSKDYRVHYSDGYITEFVSPYANKGVALADLQLHLGVSRFETLAMGDASNDIPMMQHAKYSCAIGDKSNELVTKCTYRAESAAQVLDGIVDRICRK